MILYRYEDTHTLGRKRLHAKLITTKDAKSTKESEHEALDSIFEPRAVEVDQESGFDTGQLHVREQLRFVNSLVRLDALEFDDQLILNENVYPIAAIQLNLFVLDRLRVRSLECNSMAT